MCVCGLCMCMCTAYDEVVIGATAPKAHIIFYLCPLSQEHRA
jgi:hypothetical protein